MYVSCSHAKDILLKISYSKGGYNICFCHSVTSLYYIIIFIFYF